MGKRQGKRWRGVSREGRAWYVTSDEGPGMIWREGGMIGKRRGKGRVKEREDDMVDVREEVRRGLRREGRERFGGRKERAEKMYGEREGLRAW